MADTNTNIDTTNTKNTESSAVDSKETQETINTNVGTETNNNNNKNETKNDIKTLTITQEELDNLITKRLDRERKKAETEKLEAEKLAKMSAEEKAKFELDKQKNEFEKERLKFQNERMELEITKQLSIEDLPIDFAKYLMSDSAETAMSNIKEFKTVWQNALETEVNKRLKGTTPKSGGSANNKEVDPFLKGLMGK